MFRFRLLSGNHTAGRQGTRVTHRQGAVFQDERRLDELFGRDKFQYLGVANDGEEPTPEPAPEDITYAAEELANMGVTALRALAKQLGIGRVANMPKDDCIFHILQWQEDRDAK